MCDRVEKRTLEAVARFLIRPVQYMFPTFITTPVEILAKSMINNTLLANKPKHQIIENYEIFQLAEDKVSK